MGAPADNRDYGIDCAKVLAVVFVILHHTIDCGFTMSDTAGGALKTVWYLLHSVALTCVDLFALVTGYLCVTSNGTHKRLLDIVNPTAKTIDELKKLNLPAGVDITIKG